MADYTFTELFGPNATQNATDIVIKKADLAGVGLTAAAANSAESLAVAIFLRWYQVATENNRLLDEVNRNTAISDAGSDLYEGQTATYFRRSFAFSVYKQFSIPTLDPDDY
jgi:hypothetical protein